MKSPQPKNAKSPPRQSDIVISPDGTVSISLLWDDLAKTMEITETAEITESQTAPLGDHSPPPARSAGSGTDSQPTDFSRGEYQSCALCPRQCGFNRVEKAHPLCGDSALRVGTAGLSLGDEPAIRGWRGSGLILLSGCPLRCPSCINPELRDTGHPFSIGEFLELMFSLQEQGAHNLQILSPTVHLPALRVALSEARLRALSIPVILKSSGYERIEELQKLEGLVDIYLPDLKFGSRSPWARRAGAADYFEIARKAIAEMIRQTGPFQVNDQGIATRGVLVRHVLAPLPPSERKEVLGFLESLPSGVAVSITDDFVDLESRSQVNGSRGSCAPAPGTP